MIFYFSGTGNSFAAASFLAEHLKEPLVNIAQAIEENNLEFTLGEGERLGFVFPIYAWAPPKPVIAFIEKLILHGTQKPYTYGVCTCGGSAGGAMDLLEEVLNKKGMTLDSGYSIIMPDNYVVMFHVDAPEKRDAFLRESEETLKLILNAVQTEKHKFFRVKRGKLGGFLSAVVAPGFQRYGRKTKPFYATEECIHCGICERVCTAYCIRLKNGMPYWIKKDCNMCMACINRCPKGAIQYGRKTKNKGQYVHPCWK